jgi:23S rRNA pseudouridine1911/1915/1917 synthase
MPIVGDQVYGNRQLDRKIRDCPTRQMLHAAEFSFDHPKTGKRITFKAPLPKDFQELLNHA